MDDEPGNLEETTLLSTLLSTIRTTSQLSSLETTTPSSFISSIMKIDKIYQSIEDTTITTTKTDLPINLTSKFIRDPVLKLNSNDIYFTTIDYSIFIIMLGLSALIGIYFGFISKRKQNNTAEYLLGGKTMSTFPVSASLIASHVSGITLLGVPTEIYAHGTQYWAHIICAFAVGVLMTYVYLPVFYDLQLTSCFTYLEKRFDRSVRMTASFIYSFACIVFIPIVIYVPALAFSQVTGINLHLISPIICTICIFYTTIGGLRAVVWTDTLQFILMMGAIIAITVLGILSVGGFIKIWEIAERGNRLVFFNMDPNPLIRSSFWTVSFGLTITWISNLGVSQGCVQRFLAVPDIRLAQRSVWIFVVGLIIIKGFCCFIGLIMYAKYEKCDPYTIGVVQKIDQTLPYYVMDVGGQIPGLPGLFIAGIFSAALSTLSSSLNTLAGTIYEDFFRHRYPDASEKFASNAMKIIVVVLGIFELLLVFVVEHMGAIFRLTLSLTGLTSGTLLGIFSMGMFLPKANTKGVITGAISSIVIVGIIVIGAQALPKPPSLTLSTDECPTDMINNGTSKIIGASIDAAEDIYWLFRISFMYYSLIGVLIVFIVGYPVSLLTGGGSNEIDEILITPLLRSKEYNEKLKKIQNASKLSNLGLANAAYAP